MSEQAILVLADGSVFRGKAIGALGHTIGEVVFNTSMTGYQEILTDPSYTKQIVTLTYPHIGNTGANSEDVESDAVYAAGLIIRDLPLLHSNFRSEMSLQQYLQQNNVVAIADIDTRRLTRLLRDKGAMPGCIMAGEIDQQKALELAQSFGSMAGKDLAKEVTCKNSYEWTERVWQLGLGYPQQQHCRFHVVAYDFGVKRNILRMLAERGCHITVVPATTPASGNHPVEDLDSKKVLITSQNHGFEVDADSLPQNVRITHRSLFDGSVQGIELTTQSAFSFQGHPEASPGPHDVAYLFDKFIHEMDIASHTQTATSYVAR